MRTGANINAKVAHIGFDSGQVPMNRAEAFYKQDLSIHKFPSLIQHSIAISPCRHLMTQANTVPHIILEYILPCVLPLAFFASPRLYTHTNNVFEDQRTSSRQCCSKF